MLGYTNGDLGSISSVVDSFIDIFAPKRRKTTKQAPSPITSPTPAPYPYITPTQEPLPTPFPPPTPTEPGVPAIIAPVTPSTTTPSTIMPSQVPLDKFIDAISPIKIQFVSPLEIKTSGMTGVASNDPTKPSTIIPISSQVDTSKPIVIHTIDQTPPNPNAVAEREKDRKMWEKWQYIGLAVAIVIPITTVFLTWLLNSKKSSGRRKNKRRR